MSGQDRPCVDAGTIEGFIRTGSVLLGLVLVVGLAWIVSRSDARALETADRFFSRRGPTRHGSVISLRLTQQGRSWTAWAACYASAQPLLLKVHAKLHAVGPSGLLWAARQLNRRFNSSVTADSGSDLADALSAWPSAGVWLSARDGALLALDRSGHQACLLISNTLMPDH